jgi:lysophospholipase L1-like esterase
MIQRIREVLIGLTVTIICGVVLECSARIIVTILEDFRPRLPEWYVYSADLGWAKRPNFSGLALETNSRNIRYFDAHGFLSADTEQVSNSKHPKIIALGDSNTFGWGIPTAASFVEVLDNALENTSVINLGVLGYTSFQGYKSFLKHGVDLHPALVIVSFNFNDRRYVLAETDIDSDAKFEREAEDVKKETIRKRVYLLRLVRNMMAKAGVLSKGDATDDQQSVDVRKLVSRVPPDQYRNNLVNIALTARDRNIPVIFLLLGDNPIQTEHLREGITFLEKGHYDAAIKELKAAVNLNNQFSDLSRKYLAQAYDKLGLWDKANASALVAHPIRSAHGGKVIYLDIEYNGIMRQVAHEYDVKLVDGRSVLNQMPHAYLDFCHPDEEGHMQIASLLQNAVVDVAPPRLSQSVLMSR